MDTDDKRDSGERKVQIFPFYIHEDLRLAAPQLNTTLLINVHQNAGLKEDLRASGVVWFQIYNWYLYTKRKIWPVSHLHSPHLWCSEILNKFLEHTAPIIRSCSVKKKKHRLIVHCLLQSTSRALRCSALPPSLNISTHTFTNTKRKAGIYFKKLTWSLTQLPFMKPTINNSHMMTMRTKKRPGNHLIQQLLGLDNMLRYERSMKLETRGALELEERTLFIAKLRLNQNCCHVNFVKPIQSYLRKSQK